MCVGIVGIRDEMSQNFRFHGRESRKNGYIFEVMERGEGGQQFIVVGAEMGLLLLCVETPCCT